MQRYHISVLRIDSIKDAWASSHKGVKPYSDKILLQDAAYVLDFWTACCCLTVAEYDHFRFQNTDLGIHQNHHVPMKHQPVQNAWKNKTFWLRTLLGRRDLPRLGEAASNCCFSAGGDVSRWDSSGSEETHLLLRFVLLVSLLKTRRKAHRNKVGNICAGV